MQCICDTVKLSVLCKDKKKKLNESNKTKLNFSITENKPIVFCHWVQWLMYNAEIIAYTWFKSQTWYFIWILTSWVWDLTHCFHSCHINANREIGHLGVESNKTTYQNAYHMIIILSFWAHLLWACLLQRIFLKR